MSKSGETASGVATIEVIAQSLLDDIGELVADKYPEWFGVESSGFYVHGGQFFMSLSLHRENVEIVGEEVEDLPEVLAHLKRGLDRYAYHHVPTGSFLHAVLGNDLQGALASGNLDSRENLMSIVTYIRDKLPLDCQGSPEIVKAWLKGGIQR